MAPNLLQHIASKLLHYGCRSISKSKYFEVEVEVPNIVISTVNECLASLIDAAMMMTRHSSVPRGGAWGLEHPPLSANFKEKL